MRAVVFAHGKESLFEMREIGTDLAVIRESLFENVYNLHEPDFEKTGIMIDIGANIGSQCRLAQIMGAKKIVAYEPEPENVSLLRKNVVLNKMPVEIHEKAVWSQASRIPLVVQQGDSTSDPDIVEADPTKVIKVPAVTLRDVLGPFTEVDVLKVDTEGAEYEIFGEVDVHAKARTIVVEFHKTTQEKFGRLIAQLVLTHHITLFGKWTGGGGQILARRY